MDDRVFIKKIRNQKGHNKLTEKFKGPYRVVSQKSPTVFRLKDLNTGKESEVHTELIKIVKQRHISLEEAPDASNPFPEPETKALESDTQQVTSKAEAIITQSQEGQNEVEPILAEELDIPDSQLPAEIEVVHPYSLRKRPYKKIKLKK